MVMGLNKGCCTHFLEVRCTGFGQESNYAARADEPGMLRWPNEWGLLGPRARTVPLWPLLQRLSSAV